MVETREGSGGHGESPLCRGPIGSGHLRLRDGLHAGKSSDRFVEVDGSGPIRGRLDHAAQRDGQLFEVAAQRGELFRRQFSGPPVHTQRVS